jgi:hypothetical protein
MENENVVSGKINRVKAGDDVETESCAHSSSTAANASFDVATSTLWKRITRFSFGAALKV